MLFRGKPKQYPSLTAYLRHQEAGEKDEPRRMGRAALIFALTVGLFVLLATQSFFFIPVAIVTAAFGVADWRRSRQIEITPAERLRKRARAVGKTMLQCMEKRRLHRDLDEGSLILLEESAAYWIRVHNALTSQVWTAKDLPDPYVRLRRQTLAAAAMAMDEMLLLFQPYLPSPVARRPVGDYVEEAIEGIVFNGVRVPDFPTPAFTPARQVAEKLRDLAMEIDDIRLGELLAEPFRPAAELALDQCLHDLQALNQAERELRHDMNA